MFETVLVADRGVTALRIVRTCERLGLQVVAVHADDDGRAPHVREADEVVPLGGVTGAETYDDPRKLLEAASRSGAQALHPGASPLALDADFARAVVDAGLVWLGPSPAALAQRTPQEPPGRRVTVVLLDPGGAARCLGLRERLGSLLDEQPAPGLAGGDDVDRVTEAAVRHAQAIGSEGVCAIDVAWDGVAAGALGELPLLAPGCSATEAVAGVDLTELQLRLAAGEPPAAPPTAGGEHALALQVRVAERFAGRLRRFRAPSGTGVRTDIGIAEGHRVTAGSGRLLAVVTARGADRPEALDRARAAAAAFEVGGVPTSLPLVRALLDDPSFVAGSPDAPLLERIRRS